MRQLLLTMAPIETTAEIAYSDHICPAQIHHNKADDYYDPFFFFFISHAEYRLIDICIFITWI